MRLAITGLTAFTMAAASATGFAIWRGAPVDEADTHATETVEEDSLHADAEPLALDSQPVAQLMPECSVAAQPSPSVETASSPASTARESDPSESDGGRNVEGFRQLARIMANMQAPDVAKVLGHVSDDDVEGILRQVTARQAARILSELPAERAARLSKRLLHGSPETEED